MYGDLPIQYINTYIEYTPNILWDAERKTFNENIIKKKHRKTIDLILNIFSEYSNTYLTDLIINQKPYTEAYNGNKIITIDSIRKYFNIKEMKLWIFNF